VRTRSGTGVRGMHHALALSVTLRHSYGRYRPLPGDVAVIANKPT